MPPQLTRASYLALLAWQPVWHLLLPQPHGSRNWIIALVATIPLLLPLTGVLRMRHRALVWAGYLVLLYFIVGVMEAWSNAPQRLAAVIQVMLSVLILVGVLKTRA